MGESSILKALYEARVRLPAAVIDLDAFDENARAIAENVAGSGMKVRIASKSLRVPELLRRALQSESAAGLMCYSGFEAAFLSAQGFDDFLIAYPTLQAEELKVILELHASGKKVSLVVDCVEQMVAIDAIFKTVSRPLPLIFEYDMSLRIGGLVIGVRRSPLRTIAQVLDLIKKSQEFKRVSFAGIMAYEAQVAGVGDRNPFKPIFSFALKAMRRLSAGRVASKRAALAKALRDAGVPCPIFNGGGTGSLSFNRNESSVLTEVTAGSGYFCSHLFDYYSNFSLKPAAYFALQVTRKPEDGWYACQGGGYIASGEPGWDRLPRPVEFSGSKVSLSNFEGTGEVQTPVASSQPLVLGEALLFRPAKAGEWLERFNEVHLFSRGKIVGTAKTYRGFGECYY